MSRCFGELEDLFEGANEERKYEIGDNHWFEEFKDPQQYIEAKLKMLRKDMRITPTQEELDHLTGLTTATAIDNAIHSIIDRHWE